jgi:hypothetical protein
VVDDPVRHGELGDKSDDAHLAAALGPDHRRPGTRTEFRRIRNMSPLELSHPAAAGDSKKHLVKDSLFGMPGAINPCHGKDRNLTNEPDAGGIWGESDFPWK